MRISQINGDYVEHMNGECSAHSEWLQYVSTERVQKKTR